MFAFNCQHPFQQRVDFLDCFFLNLQGQQKLAMKRGEQGGKKNTHDRTEKHKKRNRETHTGRNRLRERRE